MNSAEAIMEFCCALEDSKKASRAMFRLCEEVATFGVEIEIDLGKAVKAQRMVESEFFRIENFLKEQAQEYRRTHT